MGAGRVDICDIVARREEDWCDRYTARERAHDYLDQCAARVREARSHEQQGRMFEGILLGKIEEYYAFEYHAACSPYSLQAFRPIRLR